MTGAEFVFRNTNSADPFLAKNMKMGICRFCEQNEICRKGDNMPVISALSRYAIRWYHELKAAPRYPVDGTWEDQPNWFMELISQAANVFTRLETEKLNESKGRK